MLVLVGDFLTNGTDLVLVPLRELVDKPVIALLSSELNLLLSPE